MQHMDSVEKIVMTYFASFATRPFTFKGMEFIPKELSASPNLARGYTCPAMCGGCCKRYTLDYIEEETGRPSFVKSRMIQFDGREVPIYSYMQDEDGPEEKHCHYLRKTDGRCELHGHHPFSCDFELIRVRLHPGRPKNYIGVQLFGRGWSYERVTPEGGRGCLSKILPAAEEYQRDTAKKLRRLAQWMRHFGLDGRRAERLASMLERGPFKATVIVPVNDDPLLVESV